MLMVECWVTHETVGLTEEHTGSEAKHVHNVCVSMKWKITAIKKLQYIRYTHIRTHAHTYLWQTESHKVPDWSLLDFHGGAREFICLWKQCNLPQDRSAVISSIANIDDVMMCQRSFSSQTQCVPVYFMYCNLCQNVVFYQFIYKYGFLRRTNVLFTQCFE